MGLTGLFLNCMQEKDFRFIDNAVNTEEGVCTINLFSEIDEYVAREFVAEFRYLESCYKPTRIDIRINSAGGSVLHGWSIVDAVLTSTTPTRAIVVGVAASMASVIMTAADESHIMDYASIMVHNPFNKKDKADKSPMIDTFRDQLIALYTSRWNKSEAEIAALMDGDAGQDGTWIKASKAVEMGIVSQVIATPAQDSNKFFTVSNILNSAPAAELIQSRFQEILNSTKQGEKINMKDVIAKLGLDESTTEADVLAKVEEIQAELANTQATIATSQTTIADLTAKVADLNVEKAGAKSQIEAANATIADITATVETLTAKVATYEADKMAAEKARQESIVDAAVETGKINAADKELYLELFQTRPETTEKVIASLQEIGKKKKLSEQTKPEIEVDATIEEVKLPNFNDLNEQLDAQNKRK